MEEIKYITIKLANVDVIFTQDELKAFMNAIVPLVVGECKPNGTFYKFVKNIEHATYHERLNLTLESTCLETGKELAEKQGIKFE